MVPESTESLNYILKKIYGVDLLTTVAPAGHRNAGEINNEFYRGLWEHWSVSDWQDIMMEFGVTDILTPPDWRLKLPIAVENNLATLYTIPGLQM